MPQTQLLTLILAATILTLAGALVWIAMMPGSPETEKMEQAIPDARIPR